MGDLDPALHDARELRLGHPHLARGAERVVEVRPDLRRRRSGRVEGVARRARLREHLLARGQVGVGEVVAAAARQRERGGAEGDGGRETGGLTHAEPPHRR
jgi:hypothetical protein